jgi:hypothetical protein
MPGVQPRYAQLYAVDEATAETLRMRNTTLRRELLQELTVMLQEHNPYTRAFRRFAEDDTPTLRLVVHTPARSEGVRDVGAPPEDAAFSILFVNSPEDAVDMDDMGALDRQRRPRDIRVRPTAISNLLTDIDPMHAAFAPLHFPLLLPRGQPGWAENMTNERGKRLTMRQWAAYRIMERRDDPSLLHCGRRLFEEFVCEMAIIAEDNELTFIATHQQDLRVDTYDHVCAADGHTGADVGRRTIIPATHVGNPRFLYERQMDAIAAARATQPPTYFITFTCNPRWPEILAELGPGETAYDRPDMTQRVFDIKLAQFIQLLRHDQVLGRVVSASDARQWQEHNLPHAHLLVSIAAKDVPRTADAIDAVVCAELPDARTHPLLRAAVEGHMVHGPCGHFDRTRACSTRPRTRCADHYPWPFVPVTYVDDDGHVHYRRRDDRGAPDLPVRCPRTPEGRAGAGVRMDSSWVVPYNPTLLLLFDCHIKWS